MPILSHKSIGSWGSWVCSLGGSKLSGYEFAYQKQLYESDLELSPILPLTLFFHPNSLSSKNVTVPVSKEKVF